MIDKSEARKAGACAIDRDDAVTRAQRDNTGDNLEAYLNMGLQTNENITIVR